MKKTVELVNLWGDFEEKHPGAGIEDFCRYHLSSTKQKENGRELFDGMTPPYAHATLLKLMSWIHRLYQIYANSAMSGLKLKQFEEFIVLKTIKMLNEPKKTEAIYLNLLELSTGLNLLASLKQQGYIDEYDDPNDKRSKRVKITLEGEKILEECYVRFKKVSELIFSGISVEDIELCILLLKDIEMKFSPVWQQHKCKSFDEVYAAMHPDNESGNFSA